MTTSSPLHVIFHKKKGLTVLLETLLGSKAGQACIEDLSGVCLYGRALSAPVQKQPILLNDSPLGWVSGEQAETLAGLLQYLLEQESILKKMGAEVLNMYREINLIYNFSEKLADTIEPASIAHMALEEAGRLLPFLSGAVILWDEEHFRFDILAQRGPSILQKNDLFREDHFIRKIAASNRTEIVNDWSELDTVDPKKFKSLIFAALKVKNRSIGSIILAGVEEVTYTAGDLKLLTTLALQSASSIESALLYEKTVREALEREESMRRIHEVTSKFVPYEFIRALGRNTLTDLRLGDHVERTVTVMFTDVRDYTARSEQMSPEESFHFVSELNGFIGPIIRQNRGFVNQYLGDGVMAIFPENPSDALNAAIQIQKAIEKYNQNLKKRSDHHVKIGIGMHTGDLIMGITGDHQRMEAATISDTVNTAARIEGLTKTYQASILLTKETLDQVANPKEFRIRYLGDVQLKGKQAPVCIYDCLGKTTD